MSRTEDTAALQSKAASYVAARQAAKMVWASAREAGVAAEDEMDAAEEAVSIAQVVAKTVQEDAHTRISGVVTRCLATVFDEPYEFHIRFERARGRTEARLVFVRDGQEIDPLEASGGGVVDVAAFALRESCLMLSRPARRRAVLLDEPFKFVSADRRGRVRAMLEGLAADLGTQFIMITHIDELRCGKVIELD